MRTALSTASSKVTPSDSPSPKIQRSTPTEMISVTSPASVPSSSSCLLASSPTRASCKMKRLGKLTRKGDSKIRGCSWVIHAATILASHNNFQSFYSFINVNDVDIELLHGGCIISFITSIILLFTTTDLSMMSVWFFQDTLRRETQNFLHPESRSLTCLFFINFSSTAN